MISDVRGFTLPSSVFASHRERLMHLIPDDSVAIFFAGRAPVMSEDDSYRFFCNRNFYYLTGIEAEESALTIRKQGGAFVATLYIFPRDPSREKWTGRRLSPDEASSISGIDVDNIALLPSLEADILAIVDDASVNIAYDARNPAPQAALLSRLVHEHGQEARLLDVSEHLTSLRMVKSPEEVDAIRMAIRVTEEAIDVMREKLAPGVTEAELYATLQYEMTRRGCLIPGFDTITAGGENTLCLHYPNPMGTVKAGDMLQIDVGARAAGYSADISRAFPVDGSWTKKQALIRDAVMDCKAVALAAIHPGATMKDVHTATRACAAKHLAAMGLITKVSVDSVASEKSTSSAYSDEDISRYYWHNTGHHLGLDVHDVSHRDKPLEAGNVLAIEPGIYVEEWGFGFRIEDDILVTKNGSVYLSDVTKI
ncbi:MAG TPA: Xaa-Pro peptidase family protein [Bacillota bacterium]|mgnify:CR=1 FL=1|nr:Xaa-Pro peptidase family protein [Bacillota bacterium]